MKKKHILIISIFLIVLFFVFYFSQIRKTSVQKKINIIETTQSYISPHENIIINFNDFPQNFSCTIKNSNIPEYIKPSISYKEKSMVISSRSTWPERMVIKLSILCDNFSRDVSFIVKDQSILTKEEVFAGEVKNQVETARQREEYIRKHPYIQYFPIVRENYMILFLEKEHVMYVSPKEETFTQQEKEEIEKKERLYIRSIGVPENIPFVFSLK